MHSLHSNIRKIRVWFPLPLFIAFTVASPASAYFEKTVQGITYGTQVAGDRLQVKVACPTTGWVAIGFEPSKWMADANILIGYVKPDGTAAVRDDFGVSKTSHKADTALGGTSDVADVSGTESGGVTTLFFSIPLDSGDAKDVALPIGKNVSVILACGKKGKDDFTSMHDQVAYDSFTLQ